jgi:hypothetical protein
MGVTGSVQAVTPAGLVLVLVCTVCRRLRSRFWRQKWPTCPYPSAFAPRFCSGISVGYVAIRHLATTFQSVLHGVTSRVLLHGSYVKAFSRISCNIHHDRARRKEHVRSSRDSCGWIDLIMCMVSACTACVDAFGVQGVEKLKG